MHVEVAYALPNQQWLVRIAVPANCTVTEAITRSGLDARVPGGLPPDAKLGVWNRITSGEEPLKEGDRVEIYRPLLADPKEARRNRARQQR